MTYRSMFAGASRRQMQALALSEAVLAGVAILAGLVYLPRHAMVFATGFAIAVVAAAACIVLCWRVFVVAPRQIGQTATSPKLLLTICLTSVVLALAFEACTLFGAPKASPFTIADWNYKRVLTFLVLSLALVCWVQFFHPEKRAAASIKRFGLFVRDHKTQLLIVLAGSAGASLAGSAIITVASGFSEPVPLGVFLFVALFDVAVIIVFRRSVIRKVEYAFLLITLTFGGFLCCFVPLMMAVSWDDQIHYSRAVAVSYLGDSEYTQADAKLLLTYYPEQTSQGYVLTSDSLVSGWDQYDEMTTDPDSVYQISDYRTFFNQNALEITSVGYVPTAIGLWIGRLLHVPFHVLIIFGRLGNLIAYAALVFFGMRRLKSKKLLMGAISLLPTSLYLAANFSYDPWMTGCLLYGFAVFLGELQTPQTPVSKGNWARMLVAFLLGLAPKAVYFPVILALLFMPSAKFKTPKQKRWFRASVVIAMLIVLASFAVPMLIGGPGQGDTRGGEGVNAMGQVQFILSNPVQFMSVLFGFLSQYLAPASSSGYITLLAYFGYSAIFSFGFAYLFVFSFLDSGRDMYSSSRFSLNLPIAAILFIVVALIATALYITYNPVASTGLGGCQPRYLLPLLFPFFALCLNFRIDTSKWASSITMSSVFLSILLLCGVIGDVFLSKFVG